MLPRIEIILDTNYIRTIEDIYYLDKIYYKFSRFITPFLLKNETLKTTVFYLYNHLLV